MEDMFGNIPGRMVEDRPGHMVWAPVAQYGGYTGYPVCAARAKSAAALSAARFLKILLMEETLGAVMLVHTLSEINFSLISQAKMVGLSRL